MLAAADPLPLVPRRVVVAGLSGVGKTTYAAALGRVLGVPHVEIDALFHGPGWTPRPSFVDDVRAFVASGAWVTEWQYPDARPLVAARAEVLVWLDLPFALNLVRVVRRTVRRRWRREVLWNGNTEPPLRTIFTDRDQIIRWAVRIRHQYRSLVPEAEAAHPALVVVRLRSRREARDWLERLSRAGSR